MTDVARLLERCRRGDDLAWETLVRRYQSRVYAVAYHYVREADEARDVAQEIFVRVYQKLDSFDHSSNFLAWLMRLARNACIDRLRRRAARPPASDLPIGESIEVESTEPDPEEHARRESERRLLHRALAGMSEANREMILLREIQGLKLEEIASMLGLPLGTVKSRSSRARIELASRVRAIVPAFGASS
ncbi:MAG TPA: sigma-70 family RNA polymerase sigma factor [Candidatus Polarisedimenticolaceae bacterium]|nr:sigma-70 family RNA polymerase sigma factor [Candidatus Polarisedimenticolaceae bacterium]